MSFVIECTDTNLESFSPVLTVEVYENSRFVRKTITGNVISITNGQRVEFRNLNEDTYDARYKYKINTSDLKDASYNVYVKAQDNCNGETAFFEPI